MQIKLLNEFGYDEAMLGLSLSWASDPTRAETVANRLAHRQGGHNKFLETVQLWLDVSAPRYWWQEFDTYRVGVTKQSASTMHTITKRFLTQYDFEGGIDDTILAILNKLIEIKINKSDNDAQLFLKIKRNLPESFLQRRIVCMNYKVLQNMYYQRRNHRLPEWHAFFDAILADINKPEWIKKAEDQNDNA